MKIKISFSSSDAEAAEELEILLKTKYPRARINHPAPKGRYSHIYLTIAENREK